MEVYRHASRRWRSLFHSYKDVHCVGLRLRLKLFIGMEPYPSQGLIDRLHRRRTTVNTADLQSLDGHSIHMNVWRVIHLPLCVLKCRDKLSCQFTALMIPKVDCDHSFAADSR